MYLELWIKGLVQIAQLNLCNRLKHGCNIWAQPRLRIINALFLNEKGPP